ncbi:MAG TPA: glycosyltransferase family 2 protein [Thermoanaerobaculia bacterium]
MADPVARPPAAPELPFVSVVMPVRNEAAYIERALAAVFAQDYPQDRLEVLVADGLSTDGTRELIAAAAKARPGLRLLDSPGRTAPCGLNVGVRAARGEIVVRVDGHCEIERDYVSRCVAHLEAGDGDAVGGSVETIGEDKLADTIAAAMSSPFGVGGSAFRTVRGRTLLVDTVPFPAYTRAILERVGPFDEELVRNQDDEYNARLRKLGGRVLLAADVRSRYYSRGSWRGLWRQYFQYGYWKVRVLQKHPRQMKLRHFVPAAFVGTLVAAGALAFFWRPAALAGLGLLGAYAVAVLAASARAASSSGRGARVFAGLPLAFAILHVAYGAGSWAGLVRFRRRWGTESRPAPPESALVPGPRVDADAGGPR